MRAYLIDADRQIGSEIGGTMTINVRKPVEARAKAFIANASHTPQAVPVAEESSKTVVNIRFDAALLGRIDADARRLGISRTAWLHVAANGMLERAK